MRRPFRLGRFELQVRAVLVLLVLFLALLDVINLFLLRQGRQALRRSEKDRAEALLDRAFDELGAEWLLSHLRGRSEATPVELRRAALASGVDRLVLIDASADEVAAAGTAGDARLRLTARVPVQDGTGRAAGTLVGEVIAAEYLAIERSFRFVLIGQAAGVLLVLLLALGFADWVSRPYRRLAAAAREAGWSPGTLGAAADPETLVSAVRGMVEKLKAQDDALVALTRQETGGLAVAARFASSAAQRMPTGVLAVDRDGSVVALNPAARALVGCAGGEGVGRALDALPQRIEGLPDMVRACLATGTSRTREVLELAGEGGRRGHVGVAVTPALDEAGSVQGVLVLLTDLTEIRWLQERARLRDGLAAVGEMSAGIAHEMRNALGTILGHARILEKRMAPELETPVREILREVGTVRTVLDEFLAYAKPPTASRDPLAIERIACQSAAAAPSGIRVLVGGTFGTVVGDEALLRRAFGNLLQNAADAALAARRDVEVCITGTILRDGALLEILVDDDGPGIPAAAREHLFVPFFTTRTSGTGLGLALVQRTIVDMGGSIEAGDGPGGGARFRILLPIARTASDSSEPALEVAAQP